MHITGERDGPPVKVGCAVTDLTTGLYAANSIMAALLGRAKTGKGEYLDVALCDVQVATLSNMVESVLISGKRDSGRWGTAHRKFKLLSSLRFLTRFCSQHLSFLIELLQLLMVTYCLVVETIVFLDSFVLG